MDVYACQSIIDAQSIILLHVAYGSIKLAATPDGQSRISLNVEPSIAHKVVVIPGAHREAREDREATGGSMIV